MNSIFTFIGKHKIKMVIVFLIILIFLLQPMFTLKNYDILLDADTLRIYSDDELIATVDNPAAMLDTFQGAVGIGVTDASNLGIHKTSMKEIYRLEFLKSDKILSRIKIMTPKNQKAIERIKQSNCGHAWQVFHGRSIILTENHQYFLFGDVFFQKLSEILSQ